MLRLCGVFNKELPQQAASICLDPILFSLLDYVVLTVAQCHLYVDDV